jgi:hypothetical protein
MATSGGRAYAMTYKGNRLYPSAELTLCFDMHCMLEGHI